MKKLVFITVFLAISLLFFWQSLFRGLLPIPADTIVGLYHPFRDLYAKDYPRGIPFKNFLITDPVRQLYPWKSLVISSEKHLQLPLWNPYSFSGYPLLANFQSASFYPFNIFFFLLSLQYSWTLLIMLQPLLGGLFMFLYLRNLKLHNAASLLGAISFAFSGFFIAWLEWGTIAQTLLWVPLILLAKDKLLEKWTIKWMLILFFSEIAAFFAGHVQVLFYGLVITNVYLFFKVFLKTQESKMSGNILIKYWKIYLPFLLVGVFMYTVTAIQWFPTVQFILLSSRNVDQNPLTNPGWFIPVSHLLQLVAPDFFGNPTTLNYWGVWNYAEFVGYIGIAPLMFALYAALFRHDKKTWFFSALVFLSLLFALPTVFAQIPFILHIPFLSTAQPTRLLAITDFSLAILAALGLDYFLKKKRVELLGILGLFGIVFIGLWIFVLKTHFGVPFEQIIVTKQNLYLPTMLFIGTGSLLLASIFTKNKKIRIGFVTLVILITIIDLFRFGWKFETFTNRNYLFPQTEAITFLQNHIGSYRFMTTDSRILPPNFSTYYRLQSIEGYDPLYLRNYAEFIAALQRNKPDIQSPFGYNRIIAPHNYQSKLIDMLGVKYVLSFSDEKSPKLTKVFQEGETRVYENNHVLPRAFFVNQIIKAHSSQNAIQELFNPSFNPKTTAIVVRDRGNYSMSGIGTVTISVYTENNIVIQTTSNQLGFLVLTDVYYPTWHAYIDGKETKIYQTDYLFRGVSVPEGKHAVTFTDQLL